MMRPKTLYCLLIGVLALATSCSNPASNSGTNTGNSTNPPAPAPSGNTLTSAQVAQAYGALTNVTSETTWNTDLSGLTGSAYGSTTGGQLTSNDGIFTVSWTYTAGTNPSWKITVTLDSDLTTLNGYTVKAGVIGTITGSATSASYAETFTLTGGPVTSIQFTLVVQNGTSTSPTYTINGVNYTVAQLTALLATPTPTPTPTPTASPTATAAPSPTPGPTLLHSQANGFVADAINAVIYGYGQLLSLDAYTPGTYSVLNNTDSGTISFPNGVSSLTFNGLNDSSIILTGTATDTISGTVSTILANSLQMNYYGLATYTVSINNMTYDSSSESYAGSYSINGTNYTY